MTKYEEANIEFNHVRISDMIKQLQAVQEQYGDIIVSVTDDCGFACYDLKANVIDIDDWFRALQIDNCQKAANAVKEKYENVWQHYFDHKAAAEQQQKRSEYRSDNDAWMYTINAMF